MELIKPYLVMETDANREFPLARAFETRKAAMEHVNNTIKEIMKANGMDENDEYFEPDAVSFLKDETDDEAYVNVDSPWEYYDFYIIDLTKIQQ